jgi:ribose 5-phosphate isomerase B
LKIALSTDHAGIEQLGEISVYLEQLGHKCFNFGPKTYKKDDDYPDYIRPAAQAVAAGEYERGIIMGGSGQGEAMVANRVPGVRCAVYYGPAVARSLVDADGHTSKNPLEIVVLSRQHNNANMLSLGARFLSLNDMKDVISLWLNTDFSNDERHQRRINKIDKA